MWTRATPWLPMALAVVLAVTVSVGCQAMGYQAAPVALTFSPYDSSASWPSIHGGPYNADFGRNDPADELEPAWTTLGGTAMLTAPIIDDARGRFYLVSGRRRAPNLLAYRLNGTREHLEWTSLPPQLGGPGPGALASSPILDEDGNLYISDGEWFWSFSGEDGSVRWQAPMPAEEQGGEIIHPPFITAFFLPTGEVGGVTSVGKVLIYCREDGELLAEHQIEGAFSSTALDVPEFVLQLLDDCLWLTENGRFMIQDDIRLRYLGGFLGTGMAVTNTPAVIRRGGAGEPSASIYVPVMLEHTDEDGNHDVRLVRIDTWGRGHSLHLAEFGPQQGFSGLIPGGAGSATSPTANEDMSKMYIAAEDGYIYSVDTDTGAVARLEERIGHVLGSLSYDWSPQGAPLLYVGSGSKIFAIDADLNGIQWEQDFTDFADDYLDPLEDGTPPTALINGIVMCSDNRLLVPIIIGYPFGPEELADKFIWPVHSFLFVLNKQGEPVAEPLELPDVVETGAVVADNGLVLINRGSTMSSLAHCMWEHAEPFFDSLGTPEPLSPLGGTMVLRPRSN